MDIQLQNHILQPKLSYALAILTEVQQNIPVTSAFHVLFKRHEKQWPPGNH